MKAKDTVISDQGSAYHGSLVDLSDKGRIAVLEFTASSVAVLEREQKCKVGIRRYGKKDNQVAFRYLYLVSALVCWTVAVEVNNTPTTVVSNFYSSQNTFMLYTTIC